MNMYFKFNFIVKHYMLPALHTKVTWVTGDGREC